MKVISLSLLSGLLVSTSVWASTSSVPVELVQSVPIETTLQVPGIKMTQDVWVDMINRAQSSLDLEEFYVTGEPGQALDPVLAAIRTAAGRGVRVRLLIDAGFYKTYPSDPNALAQVANIEVKTIDFSSLGGIQHSKYFVIDGNEFYAGSANFDWLALTHIHEIGLHISDVSMAQGLEAIFNMDWDNASETASVSGSELSLKSTLAKIAADVFPAGYQMMASPPTQTPDGISDSLQTILASLKAAQTSFKLQVYEYDTKIYGTNKHWQTIDTAIREAAARGVQVQMAVDKTALKAGKADLEALAKVANVQIKVITVPTWSGGVIPYARLIHSKYYVVDGTSAWVGSENWSPSYFTSSRNVGIMLTDSATIANLNLVFNQVWTSAYSSQP